MCIIISDFRPHPKDKFINVRYEHGFIEFMFQNYEKYRFEASLDLYTAFMNSEDPHQFLDDNFKFN